jgi:acetyltransferase-like isoleucine patch superfamily enzyme
MMMREFKPRGLLDSQAGDQSPSHSAETPYCHALRLPRSLHDYLRSPLHTWSRLHAWLNAQWQLRNCDYVGPWTRVVGHVCVNNGGYMVIGERVQLLAHHIPSILTTFPGGRLEIGDRTGLNYGADIAATGLVKIGADCMIGTHVMILDNDFHDLLERDRRPEPNPVVIGNGVWIGNRSIIMPGVSIGDGAVIGAGSVVRTSVPPRSVVMGNPTRVVKHL